MKTTFGKVKKTLAILLAVCFLVSVTAAAVSASSFHKYRPKGNKDKAKATSCLTAVERAGMPMVVMSI